MGSRVRERMIRKSSNGNTPAHESLCIFSGWQAGQGHLGSRVEPQQVCCSESWCYLSWDFRPAGARSQVTPHLRFLSFWWELLQHRAITTTPLVQEMFASVTFQENDNWRSTFHLSQDSWFRWIPQPSLPSFPPSWLKDVKSFHSSSTQCRF